jgi:cobalamin biosynthesis Mg chelatase CobN
MNYLDVPSQTIDKEEDCYAIVEKAFKDSGYTTKRIEGVKGLPDFWVGKYKMPFAWIEVKLYRGKKPLVGVTFKDLKWQSGQLAFRQEVLFTGHEKSHLVLVFNQKGENITVDH